MENFLPPRPGPHGRTSKDREMDLPDQNNPSSVSPRITHSSGKSISDPLNLFQSSRVRPSPPGERPTGSSTPTGSSIGRMFSTGNKETPSSDMGRFGRLDNGSPRTTIPQSGSALPRQKHSFFQAANPPSSRTLATPSPVSGPVSDIGDNTITFSGFGRFKSNFFGSSPAVASPPNASAVASKPSSSTSASCPTRGVAPGGAGQGPAVSEQGGYDDNNDSEGASGGAAAKLFAPTTGSSGPAADSGSGEASPRTRTPRSSPLPAPPMPILSGRPAAGVKAPPPASNTSGNSFNQDSTRGTGELGTSKGMNHLPSERRIGRTTRPGTRPKSPGPCMGSRQASPRPSAPSKLRRPSMPRVDDSAARNGEMLSSRTERDRARDGNSSGPGVCGGRFSGRRGSDEDGGIEARQQPPATVSTTAKERRSPAADAQDKQPIEDAEGGGAIVIPDADVDAEDIRVKTARREDWIRRKDAAKARFRRECEAEVERIKSLMEEYVAELETRLDGELVDALDDTIGQKMEDNKQEKTRARKVKQLVSAFFDDPRIPKSRRLIW